MSVTDASAFPGPPAGPVRFIGQDREFWRIVLRGAVLLMFTLGIYRFWLATDIRRFFWANTEIDGRSFEYSGSAVELLRGFLIAIALILPIYTVFFITVLDFGDYGTLMTLVAILALVFLSQYGIYLARRYRLTRTVFRGLRFHQTGSALHYSICAVWWWGWTAVDPGFRLSVHARRARALQDAQHLVWRPAGPIRGQGLVSVRARLPDVACGADPGPDDAVGDLVHQLVARERDGAGRRRCARAHRESEPGLCRCHRLRAARRHPSASC